MRARLDKNFLYAEQIKCNFKMKENKDCCCCYCITDLYPILKKNKSSLTMFCHCYIIFAKIRARKCENTNTEKIFL